MAGEAHNLTEILDKIEHRVEEDGPSAMKANLSLGDVLDIVGHRAYGPLLVIIGVMSISPLALIPGSTWAFAALTLLIAAQMAMNLKHPWLPRATQRVSFPECDIANAVKKMRPYSA